MGVREGLRSKCSFWLELSFSLAESWRQFSASHSAIPESYREVHCPDKINFPPYWFFTKTNFPPDQAAV
jgi:hypothetical protein